MANPEQNNNSANVLFWFRNTVKRNVACECDISLATPVATPAAKRTRPTSPASVETRPNTGYLGLQNEPILGPVREGCASRPSRACGGEAMARATTRSAGRKRSEEHTSELQSLMRNSYAVFCLK